MKAVLKYPGAKNQLATWILSHVPPHDVYLEPYFGSGAVFFNKVPARIETINDIDGNVVNFFRVLRENPNEFARLVSLTPFSRDEYNAAFSDNGGDIERARKFAVRCWMGFGCGNFYRNGFRSSQRSASPVTTRAWSGLTETIKEASIRLLNAQIENLPAAELIKRYDTDDVFIYADPPYLPGTRKGYLYRHEMDEQAHRELLELLLRHPGKVMISGYDSPLYNTTLSSWRKVTRESRVEGGLRRTECLWMNYDCANELFKEIKIK